MLEFISTYFFTVIETLLLYWMIYSLLDCRFTAYKKVIFLSAAVLVDSLIIQFSPPISSIVKPYVFLAISTIIVQMLYKDNIFIKEFFIILSNYIFLISDFIAGNFSSLIYKTNIEQVTSYTSSLTMFFSVFSKIIAYILFAVYIRFFKRLYINISIKYWIIMDLVLGFFIVIINFFMIINNILQNEGSHFSAQIFRISICFLLMTTLVIHLFGEICFFYQKWQQNYALNLKNMMLEKQLVFQETSVADMKKIRHDIKNNLSNISYLLKENHVEETVGYIDAITSTLEATKATVNCGNKYIDAILNYEAAICKRNHIEMKFDVNNIPDLSISPTDLSSIISNVLNNAVEANMKVLESKRYLSLKMFCYKNYLSIIAENPYAHILTELAGTLVTDKKDALYHGYGLLLIKSTVNKYGGTFKYTYKNNVFTAIIMLPITPGSG